MYDKEAQKNAPTINSNEVTITLGEYNELRACKFKLESFIDSLLSETSLRTDNAELVFDHIATRSAVKILDPLGYQKRVKQLQKLNGYKA